MHAVRQVDRYGISAQRQTGRKADIMYVSKHAGDSQVGTYQSVHRTAMQADMRRNSRIRRETDNMS
jgi:hypothetical protein